MEDGDGWDVGFLTRLEIRLRAERMDTARDASTWASSPERLCRYADDGVTPTSEPRKESAPTSTRPRTSTSAPVSRVTSRPHEREKFFLLFCGEGGERRGHTGPCLYRDPRGGGGPGFGGPHGGSRTQSPLSYLFPILSNKMDPELDWTRSPQRLGR